MGRSKSGSEPCVRTAGSARLASGEAVRPGAVPPARLWGCYPQRVTVIALLPWYRSYSCNPLPSIRRAELKCYVTYKCFYS